MKYRVCVKKEFGKTIDQELMTGKTVREDTTGDVVEMVAFSRVETEADRPDALLLFDGTVRGYLKAKIGDFKSKIDATRIGWPKNLVVTDE